MTEISRRSFLRTTLLGSAALAVGDGSRVYSATARPRPNLVVLLPDQLRSSTLIGPAASDVHAPNLHDFVSESVVFDRAYITHPLCAPSRSSLLTGLWPHQTDCTNNDSVLPRQLLCFPQMLKDSSYRTGYFGKWHLGNEFFPQHGFQEWVSIEDTFKGIHISQRRAGSSDYTRFLISRGYKPNARHHVCFSNEFVTKLPLEMSKPRFLETKVCQFMESHRNEPFVAFVAFLEPHPPYNGPLNAEHPLEQISLDLTVEDSFNDEMPLRYRLRQQVHKEKLPGVEKFRQVKQKYLGLISEVDQSVGAILNKIEDLGLRERTIVVLTSDHGDMMSAHGLLGKQTMFEQSASVPYAVRFPGQFPFHNSDPISHIDFVPTMLELLNQPVHSQCVGQSRARLIRGESPPARPIFVQWSPTKHPMVDQSSRLAGKDQIVQAVNESTRAIVTPEGLKLCLRDKDKNELYNLPDDPEERHNLYYDPGKGDVVRRLTDEIHHWQERVGDALKV